MGAPAAATAAMAATCMWLRTCRLTELDRVHANRFISERLPGDQGPGKNQTGGSGADLLVHVPVGTATFEAETDLHPRRSDSTPDQRELVSLPARPWRPRQLGLPVPDCPGAANRRERRTGRRSLGSGLELKLIANDAHVGDQLQLQPDPAIFARFAVLGDARRLYRRGLEGPVAAAAAAAPARLSTRWSG